MRELKRTLWSENVKSQGRFGHIPFIILPQHEVTRGANYYQSDWTVNGGIYV